MGKDTDHPSKIYLVLKQIENFTIQLPYMYKFSKYVNFKDVINPAFSWFYFQGLPSLRKSAQ